MVWEIGAATVKLTPDPREIENTAALTGVIWTELTAGE